MSDRYFKNMFVFYMKVFCQIMLKIMVLKLRIVTSMIVVKGSVHNW